MKVPTARGVWFPTSHANQARRGGPPPSWSRIGLRSEERNGWQRTLARSGCGPWCRSEAVVVRTYEWRHLRASPKHVHPVVAGGEVSQMAAVTDDRCDTRAGPSILRPPSTPRLVGGKVSSAEPCDLLQAVRRRWCRGRRTWPWPSGCPGLDPRGQEAVMSVQSAHVCSYPYLDRVTVCRARDCRSHDSRSRKSTPASRWNRTRQSPDLLAQAIWRGGTQGRTARGDFARGGLEGSRSMDAGIGCASLRPGGRK